MNFFFLSFYHFLPPFSYVYCFLFELVVRQSYPSRSLQIFFLFPVFTVFFLN